MREQPVVFKGTRKGLHIYISNNSDISEILEAASGKLESGKPFFEGATVNLSFIGREFESNEQSQLLELFSRYMKLGKVEFQIQPDSKTSEGSASIDHSAATDHYDYFNGIEEGMTRFVRGTVRSGQRVFYEGNIVIIGDVNPGGEVIAGGNILVLGTLRGVAHAGATGNQEAVVASYCLQPTQLRIAGFIARAPEGETEKPSYPEVAYIREEQLFIEPYLPGKGKQPDSILFNKV
jgi:septum site-determining protein MinC